MKQLLNVVLMVSLTTAIVPVHAMEVPRQANMQRAIDEENALILEQVIRGCVAGVSILCLTPVALDAGKQMVKSSIRYFCDCPIAVCHFAETLLDWQDKALYYFPFAVLIGLSVPAIYLKLVRHGYLAPI